MACRGRGEVLLWGARSPSPAHMIANSSLLAILHGLAWAHYLFSEAGHQYPFCLHELTMGCRWGRVAGGPVSLEGVQDKSLQESDH